MCTSTLIFMAKWCLFRSTASQANGKGNGLKTTETDSMQICLPNAEDEMG